jgi:UBX domain-containing protein 1
LLSVRKNPKIVFMRNIRGLFDKSRENQSDQDDNEETEGFAGGHKSGLAVQYPGSKRKKGIVIKSFRNGFLVDDGPFRPLSQPNNAQFMSDLRAGNLPDELKGLVTDPESGLQVSLSEVDSVFDESQTFATEQRATPSSQKPAVFSGHGQTLGLARSENPQGHEYKPGNFPVPPVEPGSASVIQLRLPGGHRISRTFASITTGVQLRDYVAIGLGVPSSTIVMLAGFPPKPMDEQLLSKQTISDMGLSGSAVQVTLR